MTNSEKPQVSSKDLSPEELVKYLDHLARCHRGVLRTVSNDPQRFALVTAADERAIQQAANMLRGSHETGERRCGWFGEGRGQCLLNEGHESHLQTRHHTCSQDGRLLDVALTGLAAVREAQRRSEQPLVGPEVSFDTLQEDAAARRDAEANALKAGEQRNGD